MRWTGRGEHQFDPERLDTLRQADSSGTLVARLVEIGIRSDTLAALCLIPLVEVAWADGRLDPPEREALLAAAAAEYYESLVATGSNAAMANRMHDFGSLNDVIGTDEMLALGKTYEGKS